MEKYDHKQIESRWRREWSKNNLYLTRKSNQKKKKYILDMWPYPSGLGLHVGHVEGYTATDIYARYLRMKGYEVMHPMGWDAFGLPSENYAIKTGKHPVEMTKKSIATFREQMERLGLGYDFEREQNTSEPDYYKWTQWIFMLMFKRGLAYKAKSPANWCPSCETVLANEQVVNGKCERCDSQVVQKLMEQWFFGITKYAQRLLDGLDKINWPASTKAMQRNWIGKKEGWQIKFGEIEVFTTRPDTLHGATFVALSHQHPLAEKYLDRFEGKTEGKEKFGVDTGQVVVNPATGSKVPVWVVNYVANDYGTGAIMGVPAHDDRDREFAIKYGIEIVEMEPDDSMKKFGQPVVNYRLRDWLVSRQRYWGTPIPMIWCEKCSWQTVPEKDLPVVLPTDVDFKPRGESPIARSVEFQKGVKCPKCGGVGKREVDTMDTFVDSSWYFLRFCDPKNSKKIFDKSKVEWWMPVDLYVGGDHATTHLIYARFVNMALFDLGLVPTEEPFAKFYKNGHVLGEDNRKMSKRWGNVVNPLEIADKFGADTLRMYEMFMGPLDLTKVWSMGGVEGIRRFLDRLYRRFEETYSKRSQTGQVNSIVDRLVSRVTRDVEDLSFNTAIAAMMEALNGMKEAGGDFESAWRKFVLLLAPFAPHLAEELWEKLGHTTSVHLEKWPEYDPLDIASDWGMIVVQVDGKVREKIELDPTTPELHGMQEQIEQLALASDNVKKYLKRSKYRVIFVPGKIINFVIQK